MYTYNGQSGQDQYILSCLKYKRDGTFLEIGSHDAISINNTYLLERDYNWRGVMVEYNSQYLESYKEHRGRSKWIIEDATTVDYVSAVADLPSDIDYLQIDLEVTNNSTLMTLERVRDQLMGSRRFAVVTFEHDVYFDTTYGTREKSRQIFSENGYELVFPDVMNCGNKYEDWYVHPALVDMDYINAVRSDVSMEYRDIIARLVAKDSQPAV